MVDIFIVVILLVKIILIMNDRLINNIDEDIVNIPVNFRAFILSFIRIKKISVRIIIDKYIRYKFMLILLITILQYHIYS